MKSYNQILLANKVWADDIKEKDPEYFKNLSLGQSPKYFWIGCCDSRIPETRITDTGPGEFFVHRNIANIFNPTDSSVMSALKYAVDYLKIKHIVICGHYQCGGVNAAIDNLTDEHLGDWISHLKILYNNSREELDKIENKTEKADRLAEISAVYQAKRLHNCSIVQNAKKRGQRIFVHAWVFNMYNGELKQLKQIDPDE